MGLRVFVNRATPPSDLQMRAGHMGVRRLRTYPNKKPLYVIVPPQSLAWGAPPASWYIDSLMRHEKQPYSVGLLKAAEVHGASHQAVMEFQIITDRRLPKINAGRSCLAFYYRKNMEAVAKGIEEHRTDTGRMKVSSVELTMLDLLRYPHAGGSLDNLVTALSDLGERIDPQRLAALASAFERSVLQRFGYVLDKYGQHNRAGPVHETMSRGSSLPWVELQPSEAAEPDLAPEPVERDQRWHVIVRREPEADE